MSMLRPSSENLEPQAGSVDALQSKAFLEALESQAWLYERKIYPKSLKLEDREKAFQLWLTASKYDSTYAIFKLAVLCNKWKKDPIQAFELAKKAADRKVAEAQFLLGLYYYHGIGIIINVDEAIKWLQKASDQGKKICGLPFGFGL